MKHVESRIQQACVRWFRMQYPHLTPLLVAIPNGGKRSRFEAAIMKGEGVTAGVPDLLLALPSGNSHGLFIEMKSPTGKLTDNQRCQIAAFNLVGYPTVICNSIDKFIKDVSQHVSLSQFNDLHLTRYIAENKQAGY